MKYEIYYPASQRRSFSPRQRGERQRQRQGNADGGAGGEIPMDRREGAENCSTHGEEGRENEDASNGPAKAAAAYRRKNEVGE